MRRLRPAVAVTAVLTLTLAAAPAMGATTTTTTPASGAASSSLTILDVALGGHTVQAGDIAAVAKNTTSPHVAQIVVTPAVLDGTPYGRQTVTPASAPVTVPAGSPQTVSVPNLLSLTGPTLAVDAKDSAAAVLTSAVLKALGTLTLTPAGLTSLPVNLQAASLDNVAKVTSSQAEASKSIVLGGLSLPSINDLLKGLGVNLTALLDQLTQGNLSKLGGLVDANLATLNTAVDTAQAALTTAGQTASDSLAAAQSQLSAATAAASTAQTTLNTAQTALNTANSAWTTAIGGIAPAVLTANGVTSSLTPAEFQALLPAVQTALDAATSADLAALAASAISAQAAFTAAQTALTAANNVVTLVNNLIDALQALVNGVLNAVTSNGDPLAQLGNITIQTKAVAATTSPAPVAEAKVGTVKVLGNDAVPAQLTSVLGTATTTLSDVLRSVTGVTFTPPAIAIGTGHTSRSTVGSTRKATASIIGLTITLPSIALPASLSSVTTAVPGAATIVGNVVSVLGGSVQVGTLSEAASYTPSKSTTTTTKTPTGSRTPSGPSLAGTGMSRTVPAIAALLVLGALAMLYRRRPTEH